MRFERNRIHKLAEVYLSESFTVVPLPSNQWPSICPEQRKQIIFAFWVCVKQAEITIFAGWDELHMKYKVHESLIPIVKTILLPRLLEARGIAFNELQDLKDTMPWQHNFDSQAISTALIEKSDKIQQIRISHLISCAAESKSNERNLNYFHYEKQQVYAFIRAIVMCPIEFWLNKPILQLHMNKQLQDYMRIMPEVMFVAHAVNIGSLVEDLLDGRNSESELILNSGKTYAKLDVLLLLRKARNYAHKELLHIFNLLVQKFGTL